MRLTALNFHGIGEPGSEITSGEYRYWIGQEDFERIIAEVAACGGMQRFRITFDDGNRSDLEIAAPLLARHGLHGRFFVLSGRLGSSGYLNAEDVRQLHEMGFGIGSHGVDHVDWASLNTACLRRELEESRGTLEDILGQQVTEAAAPFGIYRKRVLNALKAAGYDTVWTSDGGEMREGAFLRPRISIHKDMDLNCLNTILFPREGYGRRLRRRLAMARKWYF